MAELGVARQQSKGFCELRNELQFTNESGAATSADGGRVRGFWGARVACERRSEERRLISGIPAQYFRQLFWLVSPPLIREARVRIPVRARTNEFQ